MYYTNRSPITGSSNIPLLYNWKDTIAKRFVFKFWQDSRKNQIFSKNIGIDQNKQIGQNFFYRYDLNDIKFIIILLKGNYTDSYGNNGKKIDQVAYYNLVTNKFGLIATPFDDKVREFLISKSDYK